MVLEIRFFDSEVSHWLYPGYMNLTTFRGAVLPLLADDDPTRSARACYLGLVALTALQVPGFSIGTWWQVASRFGEGALDAPAVVRFYQFSCDLRRLDEFVPGHLLLSRLHGLEEISFWHGPPPDTRSNAARHRKGTAVPLDGAAAPLPLQDEPVDPPDLEDDIPDENEDVSRRKKRAKADDEAHDDAADGDEYGDEDDDDDAGDDGDDDGDDGCGN